MTSEELEDKLNDAIRAALDNDMTYDAVISSVEIVLYSLRDARDELAAEAA